jgi:YD repeat-containing protein
MSDREQAGLRGPVRTCVERTIFSNGTEFSSTTEYSPDGKTLTSRHGNSDGSEWITTNTYDAEGRLVSTTSGKAGEPGVGKIYTYDDAGRRASVTNNQNSDRTNFQYDELGHETEILSFDPRTLEQNRNTAFGGSAWQAMLAGAAVPTGGTVAVLYDENDRPLEAQVRDGQGNVVSRIVRTYDAKGRLSEEKRTWENPSATILDRLSPETRSQMNPAEAAALAKGMATLFRGRRESGTVYSYDGQDRIISTREINSFFEKTTTVSYDDQGDKSEERTTFAENAAIPIGVSHSVDAEGNLTPSEPAAVEPPQFPLPETSEARYSYQHDSFGNWTEQTTTGGVGTAASSTVRRRTLTYY